MDNYTNTLEKIKYEEHDEDLFEYISELFAINDLKVLDSEMHPFLRLEELNNLKANVLKESESTIIDSKDEISKITEMLESFYLKRILEDLLGVRLNTFFKDNIFRDGLFNSILDEMGYLDAPDLDRFNYTCFDRNQSLDLRRKNIVNELCNGDYDRYLNLFKNKILIISKTLFKQILLVESQKFTNQDFKKFISYLLQDVQEMSYADEPSYIYCNAKTLLENKSLVSLMSHGQRGFYESLKILKLKQKKSDVSTIQDNKYLMDLYKWFKRSKEEGKKTITALFELVERQKNFAFDKPTMIMQQLKQLQENLSKPNDELSTDNQNEICKNVRIKVIETCLRVLEDEKKYVNKIMAEKRRAIYKGITKYFLIASCVFLFLFASKYGYDYFNDIKSIYKNNFYKNAKLNLEALSYPGELKDSLNPIANETRQKQRLDYINNLNNRYFKLITAYLKPDIAEEILEDSLPLLSIPQDLKDIKKVTDARNNLSKIFSPDEWKTSIEPYVGPNVLSELRAYGAINNFLIPSLAHHVIRDLNRLPLKSGNHIQIYNPPSEKDILRKDLIQRFKVILYKEDNNPGIYINNHDDNYKNIINICNILLNKIKEKKIELYDIYNRKNASVDKVKIKNVLRVISILECRLEDLLMKVKERHDYIVVNNTYRAPLE